MKIVNISPKIISIGDKVVMPDGEINCNNDMAELPAIKALAKKGLLRIDDSDNKVAYEEAKAEANKKAEEAKAEANKKAEEAKAKAKADK